VIRFLECQTLATVKIEIKMMRIVAPMIEALRVGELYSNDEIFGSLKVSNAGGIRLRLRGKAVLRAAIFTSAQSFHAASENPYHDRLEEGVLTYTAAGRLGQQTLSGANSRLIEQKLFNFPIHGFALTGQQKGQIRRTKALAISGNAGIPPTLSGHPA
jgi:hypothetical protein